MKLYDVMIAMTSNESPSPYIATSSGYANDNQPYKAFNKTTIDGTDAWFTKNTSTMQEEYLQIDLGSRTKVTHFMIQARYNATPIYSPRRFKVMGSNDGLNFNQLFITDSKQDFKSGEEKYYGFGEEKNYRFYRFIFWEHDTFYTNYTNTIVSQIRLFHEVEIVFNKNAYLSPISPMNTTKKILAKTGDSRVGLIGIANDDDNFGDIYVVGKDGKSHLTKSGIKSEVIFEGKASDIGEYTLIKDISNFKYLVFYNKSTVNGIERNKATDIFFVHDLLNSDRFGEDLSSVTNSDATYMEFILRNSTGSGSSYPACLGITIKNNTTFRINYKNKANYSDIQCYKIIGVY